MKIPTTPRPVSRLFHSRERANQHCETLFGEGHTVRPIKGGFAVFKEDK